MGVLFPSTFSLANLGRYLWLGGIWSLLAAGSLPAQGSVAPQGLTLAYWGNNLWNPGLSVAWLRPLAAHPRWAGVARVGGYWDPASHVGTFIQAGLHHRRRLGGHWDYTLEAQPLGLMRAWLPETYQVPASGPVRRVRGPGRWYYAPGLSLGVARPQGFFCRLHLLTLLPYNTYLLPQLHIEVGLNLPTRS